MQEGVRDPRLVRAAGTTSNNKQSGSLTAVAVAGLVAGCAFLLLELLASLLLGAGTPLGPAYMMMRALEAGQGATEAHDPLIVSVGIMLHLALSFGAVAVLAAVVHRWLMMPAVVLGVVAGAVLFLLTFLLAGGAGVECWNACGLTMLFNYAVFGALGVWTYKRVEQRVEAPRRREGTPPPSANYLP